MNKEQTNKIIAVIKGYKDFKDSLHLTALHTTKVLDRFVASYQNCVVYTNREEEEKAIKELMDTIKFAYSIAAQHKKMQGIMGAKLKTLFHAIHLGVNEDEAYVSFPEEKQFELSAKTAFNEIISALREVSYMLDEYKAVLKAKGKPGLSYATDELKKYFDNDLIPYYIEFGRKVTHTFENFNLHKRGYAVAIKELPLKIINQKLSAYDIAQDRIAFVKTEDKQMER